MKLLMTFLILLLSPLIASARPLFLPKPTPKNPKDQSPKHTNIIAKSNNQRDFLQQLVGCCDAGRRYDGLAQLKHHFHRLGYMISGAPSTDEFDDEFRSAIRTYQHKFNLDVTGLLDSQTIDHIAQPRCGNPDIISSSTSGTHDHDHHRHRFHIVSHYSFYDGMPSWKGRKTLTYGFLPASGSSPLNDIGTMWIFGLAFNKWSRVIPLNFTKVDDTLTADIVIAFHSLDGPGGILGNAYGPRQGEITMDADEDWIRIDGYEDTTSLPLPIDLLSVAVHEIGHALGLMHSTDIESVMYPIYPIGASKATLSKDDIEGIQQLYGRNPNYHHIPSSPSSQRPEPGI